VKPVLLGLDIGTSNVKAGLFDASGGLLGKASRPVELYSPKPGWAEQEPWAWWNASCEVIREALAQADPAGVVAVGLSGQCPGHVLVAQDQKPLGRAIIWRDQRAAEEAAWLNAHISPAQAQEWVGTDFLGDAACPPARLLWLKEHERENWERASIVLQPKDFIALLLTERAATDCHSAYCLANPETGSYNQKYFAALDIEHGKMPPALKPTEVMGEVTDFVSQQVGLVAGTKVITGTIDAYCDTLAGGVMLGNRAVDVAGTSEIVSLGVAQRIAAAGVYPARIEDSGWFLCGPTQAGGDTLRWLTDCLFPEMGRPLDFVKMEQAARAVPPGSEGLIFLPYLHGERAPIWNPNAKGAFIGVTGKHDHRHWTRSVYESVAFAIRHILDVSEAAAGKKAEEVVTCGGGSRSDFWNQIKSDVLQRPVRPTVVSETGCLGAAILASVGAGLHQDIREACERMIAFRDLVLPDQRHSEVYMQGYQFYRDCYTALEPCFQGTGRAE